MKQYLYYIMIACSLWACTRDSETEKYQNKRDHIINVREKLKAIDTGDVLLGSNVRLYILGNYLIIADYKSDKLIHIFDKHTFSYAAGIADKGKGPGEIANLGYIGVDETHRKFYVTDHGKQCIFGYDLDSVLTNPLYMPTLKMRMSESQFPDNYQYISDTLCMGKIMEPVGLSDFKIRVAKWNMNTGEIKPMKYEHPDIEKKRIIFAVSMEHGVYVECYSHHDLMTICSLNGDLKYNIYGQNWDTKVSNSYCHYVFVAICNNRIVVSYSGKPNFTKDSLPTKFLVFDMNGNYLQTLETGYLVSHFCYDKENNRIIMNLNDEMLFAYLDLDGLIK